MTKSVITGKDGEELLRLYAELPRLSEAAKAALKSHGMESQEFLKADKALGDAIIHIRKIRGLPEGKWI